MRPLAVIGNLARDIVDGRPPRVGGAPYHAARALRLLGRPARVVTKCADDDRASLLLPLVALGVPVSWRTAAETTSFAFRYDGEHRVMRVEAVGEPWQPEEAAEAVHGCEWIQAAPLTRADFPAQTLAALAASGRRLLLDGQGLVRPPRTGPLVLDADYDPDLLRCVSILKLAEDEAAVLGDVRALGVPEVVVTLGSRGARVLAGGRVHEVPARAARGRVDPTGAGDAFAAAYVAARAAGHVPASAAARAIALVAGLLSRRT